jgi:hypothetical protein
MTKVSTVTGLLLWDMGTVCPALMLALAKGTVVSLLLTQGLAATGFLTLWGVGLVLQVASWRRFRREQALAALAGDVARSQGFWEWQLNQRDLWL